MYRCPVCESTRIQWEVIRGTRSFEALLDGEVVEVLTRCQGKITKIVSFLCDDCEYGSINIAEWEGD